MNDGASAKQQIVEKIKDSTNILVTVSTDPSVDELSAALGLTIMLNNLKKHATAVVSGTLPPAMSFLEPNKTFENTVDSLRDFIIALDKEKADHLRYKVEGDVVKIFITPYRTTISEKDLDFSQGDYNVELVLALGVSDEAHLDKALEAHGRILHDATVATLTCGEDASKLGSIAWHESGASSISEMLVALSEAVKSGEPVLDEQTSTAFLTGIVAATNRFSNNKTSSKVMTMAAQLMAAGANQQLIAAKLEEEHEISGNNDDDKGNKDGTTNLSEGESSKVNKKSEKQSKSDEKKPEEEKKPTEEEVKAEEKAKAEAADGTLSINHEMEGTLDQVAKEVAQDNTDAAAEKAESMLANQLKDVAPAAAVVSATPSVADLQKDIAAASAEVEDAAQADPTAAGSTNLTSSGMPDYEPSFGSALNATTEQAAEDKRKEEDDDKNHVILSHVSSSISSDQTPTFVGTPFSANSEPVAAPANGPAFDTVPSVAPPEETAPGSVQASIADPQPVVTAPVDDHKDALADVHAAFDTTPVPAVEPAPVTAPTASQTPSPLPPLPPLPTSAPTAVQADPVSSPIPTSLPPLPDFSTLPPPVAPVADAPSPVFQPAPAEQLGGVFGEAPAAPPPATTAPDPGQFKIPGQ